MKIALKLAPQTADENTYVRLHNERLRYLSFQLPGDAASDALVSIGFVARGNRSPLAEDWYSYETRITPGSTQYVPFPEQVDMHDTDLVLRTDLVGVTFMVWE